MPKLKQYKLSLEKQEIDQILLLIKDCSARGFFVGKRKQFNKRANRIVHKLSQVLKE